MTEGIAREAVKHYDMDVEGIRRTTLFRETFE